MVLMTHAALMTSKINMQEHSEESSEGEDFGYPSDTEWGDMIYNADGPALIAESRALDSEESDYEKDEESGADKTIPFEWRATVEGRSNTARARAPRFDVPNLKPFQIMFVDEKSYDCPQRGGWTTSLIFVDMASDAWFKVDETSKTQHVHGES